MSTTPVPGLRAAIRQLSHDRAPGIAAGIDQNASKGYAKIASKFRDADDFGPTCVREFVEGTGNLDDRTPAQWQTDAFGQVRSFLDALGL